MVYVGDILVVRSCLYLGYKDVIQGREVDGVTRGCEVVPGMAEWCKLS